GQPATPAQPAAPGTTFVQNQPPVPTPVMPTTYPETALTTAREEKEIEQAAVTTRPEISRETSPWGPWGGVIPADTDANIGYFLTNLIRTNITLPLILLLLAILLIIIAFILTTRYYSRLSVRESYNVVRNDIDSRGIDKYGNRSDSANRRPIIMKVANQNDQVVGISRNIHRFKTGTVKSIGGGNSSFLIFLYKIPGAIASLKFDGTKYIFTPLRPEFFPAIEDSEVENPLDQDIKIKTEKFQMLSVKFSEYISPLEKINSTLKLTEKRSYFYDKT
ncbi:MAG: hypothetical protein FWC36_07835, partial [Spirochaetes bacterium]|nr:hypothetical protein [Spirochaetota bacterium]